jgi:Pyridoxamine 5'-phosphate oxidase
VSVKVGLDEVRDQVSACRSHAYLLTVTDDGRPHAVSLQISWDGDVLVGGAGRRSVANVERSPEVSLLWPRAGRDGYALIVDGTAEVRPAGDGSGDGGGATVAVNPTGAVLHKTPDAEGDGPGCVPVLGH